MTGHRLARRAALRVLAGVLLCQTAALSTVIYVSWTPQTVAVSVDSLLSSTGSDRKASRCKVVHDGACTAVFGGLVRDAVGTFRPMTLGRQACDAPGDIFDKATAFDNAVRGPLQRVWQTARSRITNPGQRKMLLTAIFAGPVGGAPGLVVLRYGEKPDGSVGLIERIERPGDNPVPVTFWLGRSPAWDQYMNEHPEVGGLDPVDFVRTAIRVALDGAKDDANPVIGPPATVYEVRPEGVNWVENGACTVSLR